MYILGVSGKRGVGKNYISEHFLVPSIIRKFSNDNIQLVPYFFSFGSPVKIELYSRDTLNNLDYNNLFTNKTHSTRELLQKYATENGRNVYRKDMWIRSVDMWIQVHNENLKIINEHLEKKLVPFFVIEDVRFENEYNYIRNLGGILVLVEAPSRNLQRVLLESNGANTLTHESEKGLEHLDFDLVLNNDFDKEDVEITISSFIHKL